MSRLKEVRTALGLTQEQLADLIGERQDTISRWENGDPDDIPAGGVKKIAGVAGMTVDEYLNYKRPAPDGVKVENRWEMADLALKTLREYLACQAPEVFSLDPSVRDRFEGLVRDAVRKPRIAFMGLSDTGKSTIINGLTGIDGLAPTAWTPCTSITVYFKALSDRPDYIHDEVWLFKSDGTPRGFDPAVLGDEEACAAQRVASGSRDTLRAYGTRQGDHYTDDVVAAVVYADAPLLDVVDLVDLPGFGTGDRAADDRASRDIGKVADALIFVSRSNGFLSAQEITALDHGMTSLAVIESIDNGLPALGNVMVVASQAWIVGNELELRNILDYGCTRFEQTRASTIEAFFAERSEATGYAIGHDELRARFYTYSAERADLRRGFEVAITQLAESLPRVVLDVAVKALTVFAHDEGVSIEGQMANFRRILDENAAAESALKALLDDEPRRATQSRSRRDGVLVEIKRRRDSSVRAFERRYHDVVSVDAIVKTIKSKGFKKKKSDLEDLAAHIGTTLSESLTNILRDESEKLSVQVDGFLGTYPEARVSIGGRSSAPSFDAKRVFASVLAGGAVYGALALWAAGLGNLGGYIIAAKVVSWLAAIGIGVGGVAPAVSFVAALGGPVTFFIGLAILAALSIFSFFGIGGGWEKKVAKKLVESCDKEHVLRRYKDQIRSYWDDTSAAFSATSDALEQEWQDFLATQKQMVQDATREDLEALLDAGDRLKSFLNDIPMPEPGSGTERG